MGLKLHFRDSEAFKVVYRSIWSRYRWQDIATWMRNCVNSFPYARGCCKTYQRFTQRPVNISTINSCLCFKITNIRVRDAQSIVQSLIRVFYLAVVSRFGVSV